jgi:predicted acyltransferase (DUF342 family)
MSLHVGRLVNSHFVQQTGIVDRDLVPALNFVFQNVQLRLQNGRLQGVQAAVYTYTDMVISPVLAVSGDLAQ